MFYGNIWKCFNVIVQLFVFSQVSCMHYITTLSITTVSYGILNPWNINARFTSTYNSLSHTTVSTECQELDMYNHITCMTQKYMYYKNILCTFFFFYRIFNSNISLVQSFAHIKHTLHSVICSYQIHLTQHIFSSVICSYQTHLTLNNFFLSIFFYSTYL
jgi:multisubunit Na+/H+ antiporter MnhE subunit